MTDTLRATVIPAKAGIQFVTQFRVADNAVFGVMSHCVGALSIAWIPAFAGMTEWQVFNRFEYCLQLGNAQ